MSRSDDDIEYMEDAGPMPTAETIARPFLQGIWGLHELADRVDALAFLASVHEETYMPQAVECVERINLAMRWCVSQAGGCTVGTVLDKGPIEEAMRTIFATILPKARELQRLVDGALIYELGKPS